ncbi:MAG: helicase-related protein [Bacteriovoracales bacterium]
MTKLFKHQRTSVDFFKKNKYSILALDCGLGKTLTNLTLAEEEDLKTLVIAPKYLLPTWESEIIKHTPHFRKIELVPYSQLHHLRTFKGFDFVVADECAYLKNPQSQRSTLFGTYLKENLPKYLSLSCATPILNRVCEFFTLLYMASLNPEGNQNTSFAKFGYSKFCKTFSHVVKTNWGIKYEGHKNVGILKQAMADKYIRFKAADCLDLPQVSHIHVDGKDLIPADMQIGMMDAMENGDSFSTLKKESAIYKVDLTIDKALEILEGGEQVIIFSEHIIPVRLIAQKLKVPAITGDTPAKLREEAVRDFQSGKMRAFVATSGVAGFGLNLQNASQMIFNDLSFVPSITHQCIGRINRMGQEKPVRIYYINGGEIDRLINITIQRKMETINQVVE